MINMLKSHYNKYIGFFCRLNTSSFTKCNYSYILYINNDISKERNLKNYELPKNTEI